MDLYLARNKNGRLHLYNHIPIKGEEEWWSYHGYLLRLHKHQFPEIKWEDEKPTEVKLVLK